MPTYDYRCKACGDFELWMSFEKYRDIVPCPECEASSRRVYTNAPLIKGPTFIEPFFHPSFGEWVTSDADIARAKARTEERTQTDLHHCPDLDAYASHDEIEQAKDHEARVKRAQANA